MNAFQKTGEKMTNYRWTICAMLFFATTVNYLDRQVLSLTWVIAYSGNESCFISEFTEHII